MKPTTSSSAEAERLPADSGAEARPRRRAKRLDVRISQQALEVVLPTNQEIGPWQRQAARLLALAERRQGTRHDPALAVEARTLLVEVERRRDQLMQAVQSLPQEVAQSSRLEDTARALDSVAGVLTRTLALTQPGPGVGR